MSDSGGQSSGLQVGESHRRQSSSTREFADLLTDVSQYFEVWQEDLKPKLEPGTSNPKPGQLTVALKPAPGAFSFEGILRIDGYASGSLSSQTGTLIVGESGEVESNIAVATAIVDGFLRGDIHATERVELGSNARVFGNIRSPALSIQPGAVFEGECHFLPLPYQANLEAEGSNGSSSPSFASPTLSAQNEDEAEPMAVAAIV
jgi:cytoskeletal protein CcmA (bactofilin family)